MSKWTPSFDHNKRKRELGDVLAHTTSNRILRGGNRVSVPLISGWGLSVSSCIIQCRAASSFEARNITAILHLSVPKNNNLKGKPNYFTQTRYFFPRTLITFKFNYSELVPILLAEYYFKRYVFCFKIVGKWGFIYFFCAFELANKCYIMFLNILFKKIFITYVIIRKFLVIKRLSRVVIIAM